MEKIKINILPNYYLNENGTFDLKRAILFCGHMAGICYAKEGYEQIKQESLQKTKDRVDFTLGAGHLSPYDHISITFYIENIPKILAMILNNEKQYTTSEKSARYTPIKPQEDSIITKKESELYNKWIEIFKIKIKELYGDILEDSKIKKLAQENARYLVTVFMPTKMVYTTTLRQINNIASWLEIYIKNIDPNNPFENKLAYSMKEFLEQLDNVNVLEYRLMQNNKNRQLSLFGKNLDKKQDYFGDVYTTTYKGSFAQLAQAHRHRSLNYQLEMLDKKEYYIPPILENDHVLANEWLNDIKSVSNIYPQGEMITINEIGTYENFILKTKERICTEAQLEIMRQTKETLTKYAQALQESNHPKFSEIKKYTHGARCTFGYQCPNDCKFKEGKTLTRKI